MHPSKWLVFIRPALAGFDRPLTVCPYPDEFMVRCLRRHGFRVLRLTQRNLSQHASGVNSQHVLLLSQLFRENEATWIVLFNGV